MYCRNCGTQNADNAINCVNCGNSLVGLPPQPTATDNPQQKIRNHLPISIISVFFCWPLAIVAIIYAIKVDRLVAAGNQEEAKKASKIALVCSLVGIIPVAAIEVVGIALVLSGLPQNLMHKMITMQNQDNAQEIQTDLNNFYAKNKVYCDNQTITCGIVTFKDITNSLSDNTLVANNTPKCSSGQNAGGGFVNLTPNTYTIDVASWDCSSITKRLTP